MEYIKFEYEKKYVNDFLRLPQMLYSKNTNMENRNETKKILLNQHPLSHYFHIDKFVFYHNKKVVGRFIITTYPEDDTAYLGFFECVENKEIAKYIFDIGYEFAKRNHYKKIIGPVDSSFWIKYRLKINLFDKIPYTGEPYNKDYYYDYFLDNQYIVEEHYTSNIYDVVDYVNEKYSNRYNSFLKKGYHIISPDLKDFDKIVEQIYYLITALYSDFPVYKNLSLEDFKCVFADYKYIVNMDMVKMAYYENKAVGFFISVPNYGNQVYHLNNLLNIIKIKKIKSKPKDYVLLYMGVDQKHKGLGKAIAGSIMDELQQKQLPSIGALARDGKVTQNYGKEFIKSRYEYVLLSREVDQEV